MKTTEKTYILNEMSFKEAVSLVAEVENMPVWIEKPGHVLVGDRQSRITCLQPSDGPM